MQRDQVNRGPRAGDIVGVLAIASLVWVASMWGAVLGAG